MLVSGRRPSNPSPGPPPSSDAAGWLVRATHVVTADDDYGRAHFPGYTTFLGVFLLESVLHAIGAQLDLRELAVTGELHVRSMRFVAPFRLGETIELVASVATGDGGAVDVDARFSHRAPGVGPEARPPGSSCDPGGP